MSFTVLDPLPKFASTVKASIFQLILLLAPSQISFPFFLSFFSFFFFFLGGGGGGGGEGESA